MGIMADHVECYACDWVGTIPVHDRWAECPDSHLCGHLRRKNPDGSLYYATGEEDRWACMKKTADAAPETELPPRDTSPELPKE